MSNICDECETVAHCIKHGCIPKQQALDKMAENARELGLDYEPAQQEPVAWAKQTDKKLRIALNMQNMDGWRPLVFGDTSPPAQQCKWPTCQSEEYQQALSEQIRRELVGEQPAQQEHVALEEYDAGLLNDFGGGNVEWWQDYIRAELGRAYEHYQSQMATPQPPAQRKPLTDEQRKSIAEAAINGHASSRDAVMWAIQYTECQHSIKE